MADEDFNAIEAKALKSGAVKAYVVDLQVRSFSVLLSHSSFFDRFNRPRFFRMTSCVFSPALSVETTAHAIVP